MTFLEFSTLIYHLSKLLTQASIFAFAAQNWYPEWRRRHLEKGRMHKTGSVFIVLAAMFVSSMPVYADRVWNNAQGDQDWNNDLNWYNPFDPMNANDFTVPNRQSFGDDDAGVYLAVGSQPIISTVVPNVSFLFLGRFGASEVYSRLDLVDGASLVLDVLQIGGVSGPSTSHGELFMSGGSITCALDIQVGATGSGAIGSMNLTGGSVISENLFIPHPSAAGSSGTVNLNGGIIETSSLAMGVNGAIDITVGTLVLAGDQQTLVNTYIASGWIRAYGGSGRVTVDYDQTHRYKTTVSATHSPAAAWTPGPGPGQQGVPSALLMNWTSGNSANEHDIYLGVDFNSVNNATTSDVTGLYRGRQNGNSYNPPALGEDRDYWWRIDEVDLGENIVKGNLWSFRTGVPPRDLQSDTWVATDALGRVLPGLGQTGPERTGKQVGIFYFTWHGTHGTQGPYNTTEILAANSGNPQWIDDTISGLPYWWDEPEAGYFLATDPWVLRRNISMMTDAGVDVLVIDATNALTYHHVYMKLCKVLEQMKQEGFDSTLQICFTTHAFSPQTVTQLYNEFYSLGLYSDLWFQREGKPLMLGYPDGIVSDNPRISVSQEIRDFFSWRKSWFDDPGQGKWQWGANFPQGYGWDVSADLVEQITTMPATHPTVNIGRSFQNGSQPPYDAQHLPPGGNARPGTSFYRALGPGFGARSGIFDDYRLE